MHCITTNAVIGGGGGGCKIHQINCTAVQPLVFVSLSQAQSWLEQQRLGHRASAKAFPAAWAASASANVGVDVWLFVIMLDVKNVLLLCCVVLCTSDWKWKRIRLALIGGPGSQKGLFFSFFFERGGGSGFFFFLFLSSSSLDAETWSGSKLARRFQSCRAAQRAFFVTTSGKAWLFVPLTNCWLIKIIVMRCKKNKKKINPNPLLPN